MDLEPKGADQFPDNLDLRSVVGNSARKTDIKEGYYHSRLIGEQLLWTTVVVPLGDMVVAYLRYALQRLKLVYP